MVSRRAIINSWKYKFNVYKVWFDKGYSILSYPKWVIAIYGVGEVVSGSYLLVASGALLFALFCAVVGYLWLKYDLFIAEQEVSNQYNLFQKEMRQKLDKRKVI